VSELPIWNFDGSSTGQAPGHDSEVLLKPVRIFPDPFRGAPHLMVLCETMLPDMTPHPGNTRVHATGIFDKALGEEPWYGAFPSLAAPISRVLTVCTWQPVYAPARRHLPWNPSVQASSRSTPCSTQTR
jgi:hypothetical protein